MNTIILTIMVAALIFIACSLTSIANTLWNILQELKKTNNYDNRAKSKSL